MEILPRSFYEADTLAVARALLGKVLIRRQGNVELSGRIVETEAYKQGDAACHAFRGKTDRNAPMYGSAGHTYVYFSYGMHDMLNIVTQPEDCAEAVLIRALEPLSGVELMRKNAGVREDYSAHNLLSGPGRLAKALAIKYREDNNIDLTDASSAISIWADGDELNDDAIETTKRIGINVAADLPWRFIVRGNAAVSRR